MKKLLLLSLLAMGATSFAAVEGTATEAQLPIKVYGEVIEASGDNLIITPLKNAGVSGNAIEFDFSKLLQGSSQSLDGTFEIKRAGGAAFGGTSLEVGLLDGANIVGSKDNTVNGKVGLKYAVSGSTNTDDTLYSGALRVTADVAADAATGSFNDVSQKIMVKVTN